MYVKFLTVNFCLPLHIILKHTLHQATVLQGQEQCSKKGATSSSLSQLNLNCHISICSEFCMFSTRKSVSSEQMCLQLQHKLGGVPLAKTTCTNHFANVQLRASISVNGYCIRFIICFPAFKHLGPVTLKWPLVQYHPHVSTQKCLSNALNNAW